MLSRKSMTIVVWVAALCGAVAVGATKSPLKSADQAPPAELKLERVPPKTPNESLASTEVAPGFRMDLVAAEPDVCSPVAMAFDEAGRLYVVEMIDYSEKDQARLGRIRLLTDEDSDGKYESSRIFVDDLSWPTAVACYDGGIFIGDAPDILYCKDTDGDGRADVRKVVYTGFGRSNVQGLFNTFLWGLDHKIYGQSSSSGGHVTRPGSNAPPLELHNRDFCFDPKTLEISPITGGGQHGMSFNRWGDRFVCSNSDHLQAIVFEERYVSRNPYQSVVSARRTIATDGPQAEVYRISPVEAWREARTKLRVSGAAPGPVEGGGRAAGYFTGSTGVTVYEGGLWPNDDDPRVLISDVGSNLIHRKRLSPDGATYRGDRIDKDSEFIRSKDIWFRPVQMTIGPEGGLYVMDMYREVIEHPKSIPAVLKDQLDLSSGEDRGRLYRVVPADYKYVAPKSLAKASTAELAAALDDGNQWRRMTALRLIYQQQDPAAGKLLHEQLAAAKRPEGRIALLYALDSVNALVNADLLSAIGDSHPQVRRHALRLSETRLNKSVALRKKALSLVNDPDLAVRFQAALSLGECNDMSATLALGQILLQNSDNRDICDAVLTSIVDRAGGILTFLLADEKWTNSPRGESIIRALVGQVARQRRTDDLDAIVSLLRFAEGNVRAAGKSALLKALSRLPSKALNGSSPPQLTALRELRQTAAEKILAAANDVLNQRDASVEARIAAIADLTVDKFDRAQPLLERLLSPQEPAAIRAAIFAACAQFESPEVSKLLLSKWADYTPAERLQVIDVLLRRGTWAVALAQYLDEQKIRITTLDPSHAAKLEHYPSPKVRQIARKLRGQAPPEDRQRVFQDYREVLFTTGDAKRGKELFVKNCATCHEVGGVGSAVGPNLAAMVSRGTESVLFNILAPNVEVDPRFLEFTVLTTGGEVISGVKASESSTAVTILGPEKKTTTILEVDIDEINTTGKSLMPDGFEKLIDKKAMADLLEFLKQAAAQGEQGEKK
jgi:putative membrane-bound dehydrogenase-like protein